MDTIEIKEKKDIINNSIEFQPLNKDTPNINNTNEEDNKGDSNDKSQHKIILKKNVRKIKIENSNNMNEKDNDNDNEIVPDIEIVNYKKTNSDNLENSNNYNEIKSEIKVDNFINNKKEGNNELKDDMKKEEGYLDSDLDDEENKKLYLRVIKRMEKTYSVPIIHAKIPGEPIEDIGLEENIRPILVNNNNKDINNEKPLQINSYNKKYLSNENTNNNNNKYISKEKEEKTPYKYQYNLPLDNTYELNNNPKGIRQYINYPIYGSKTPNIQNKYSYLNNNINNMQKYAKNPSINNNSNYKYNYLSQQKNIRSAIPSNNLYSSYNIHNINSKILPNKPQNWNYSQNRYIYESPSLNYKKMTNNIQKYHPNNINKRYQEYINNKIGNNEYKNYNIPIKNRNLNDIYNSYQMNDDMINLDNHNNMNLMKTTYLINNDKLNKIKSMKGNYNLQPNNYKNKYNYTITNNKTRTIPKRANISYNKNNTLKNNKYPSLTSYLLKNFYNNHNNNRYPMNQKRNIPLNKSQNLYNIKNKNFNYTGFNNNNIYRRNLRNSSQGFLTKTMDIVNDSRKKLTNSPFNSLQSFQISYNKWNMDYTPQKRIYVTYCIDSNNYH